MKTEAVITSDLMKEDRLPVGAWEVKVTKLKSLAFNKFLDHQIKYLMKATNQRLNIKIRDVGKAKKQFDGVTFHMSPAWCVCCYPSTNKKGYVAYAIDVLDWYQERRTCGRKSLTEKRASEIGDEI
jgi:hypothetical protein